jgi:hypothetical protein
MLLNNPTEGILSDSLAELLRVLNRMTPGRTGRVLVGEWLAEILERLTIESASGDSPKASK